MNNKCHRCPDPAEGRTLYFGKQPVSLCKPCYDTELRKINKAKREAFKYRNRKGETQEEIDRDNQADFQAAAMPSTRR